jgi:chromate transporter
MNGYGRADGLRGIAGAAKVQKVLPERAGRHWNRGEMKFTAPLTGIAAAVVGVILNLAVFFVCHAFWPRGTTTAPFAGSFDGFPAIVAVAVAAFIALWKSKADIMQVIGVCALLGLAYSFYL